MMPAESPGQVPASGPQDTSFSIVSGGGLHRVMGGLGLLGPDGLPTARSAVLVSLVAWLVTVFPAALQSLVNAHYDGWSVFHDATVYARYLVAIWAMIATERFANERVSLLTRQFATAGLLPAEQADAYRQALLRADTRSASIAAELLLLCLALGLSLFIAHVTAELSPDSWEAGQLGGLSWAGHSSALLSNTLFLFLAFRWFWRFGVWAALLRDISRLRLELQPLHPDRAGGLGFLGIFPGIFSGLVFALSCVVSASFIKMYAAVHYDSTTAWLAVASWLLLVLLVFLGPLGFFVRLLYVSRERGILDYGRLAQHHHREFQRQWIEPQRDTSGLLGSADPSSVSDLNASVEAVINMRVFPVDRAAVTGLLLAASLPLLAVAAARMPLAEFLGIILGVVL